MATEIQSVMDQIQTNFDSQRDELQARLQSGEETVVMIDRNTGSVRVVNPAEILATPEEEMRKLAEGAIKDLKEIGLARKDDTILHELREKMVTKQRGHGPMFAPIRKREIEDVIFRSLRRMAIDPKKIYIDKYTHACRSGYQDAVKGVTIFITDESLFDKLVKGNKTLMDNGAVKMAKISIKVALAHNRNEVTTVKLGKYWYEPIVTEQEVDEFTQTRDNALAALSHDVENENLDLPGSDV